MKKTSCLILAFVMALGMVGCGGSIREPAATAAPEPTEEPSSEIWTLQQTTDEFGDLTEDSIPVLCAEVHGNFKNTATNNSELFGTVFFSLDENSGHYTAGFSLLEYNRVAPTFSDNSEILLKVKINDSIIEFNPIGEAPNGRLFLGTERYDYNGDFLFDFLYMGLDLRCILVIDNSQYNFTIPCGNIKELCDNAGFPEGPCAITVKDAVTILLEDSGEKPNEVINCLSSHAEKMNPINYDEFLTSVNGLFLDIELDDLVEIGNSSYPMWNVIHNYEGGFDIVASYSITGNYSAERIFGAWQTPPHFKGFEEDGGLLAKPFAYGDGCTYFKCYELTNNIYLLCKQEKEGSFTASDLLIRCYDATNNSAICSAINYAKDNEVRQILN